MSLQRYPKNAVVNQPRCAELMRLEVLRDFFISPLSSYGWGMTTNRQHSKPGKITSFLLRYLVLPCALLFAAEGLARLFAPDDMTLHYGTEELFPMRDLRDGQFPFLNRAGFRGRVWQREVSINSLHLRSPEPTSYADTTGERRLLLVGNLIFGLGLDDAEAPAAVLEAYLGPSYRVLNAGVPGYMTAHERAFLEQFGDQLRPDAVVLAYSIEDPVPGNQETLGRLRQVNARLDVLAQVNRWLRSHSMLYLHAKSLFAVYRLRHDYTKAYRPLFNEASWAHNRPMLLEIVAWCRSRDLPFLLVFFPHRDQLIDAVPTDEHPQQLLAALSQEAGFAMLDLRTVLEPEDYIPNDPLHLDRRGMAKAMQAVADFFKQQ